MSGIEALGLISVLSSVLQLVDFGCEAFARIKECKEDSTHLPKQLPLISHALQITRKQAQSNELDEIACKTLRSVIEDCQVGVNDLKAILEKLVPSPGESSWKKNIKALTSCFHDKDVARIAASISHSLTVINQYHGAYTATTTGTILQKLTAAVATIPEQRDDEADKPVRHFMIPTFWSDDFTGRKETMDHLEKLMSNTEKHRRVAIVGLGGKTRVMLEYSEMHSVFWIHASSISRVNKTCLEIAKNANIPGWEDPMSNKIELVKGWLETPLSGKWVLLMDNADDFDLLFGSGNLVKSLPRSSEGAILMTTRDARVGMEFAKQTTIFLEALTINESISLLDTCLGDGSNDIKDLAELGEEICGIPLALIQASSFIRQNFLSIPSYLELYQASDMDKIELLSEDFDDDIRDPETRNPVAATWSITILSTCHYAIGRLDICLEEAERAYRLKRQFLGDNHVDTLAALDVIVKPAKDIYSFPRAVEACQLAIKGKSETLGPDHPSTLRSMANLGKIYRPMGLLEEAKKVGVHALEMRRKVIGDIHPDTFTSLSFVAMATRALGDYEGAVKLETERLKGWEGLRGSSHPETLEAMAGLAWAFACQGNYSRAAQLNSHSLSIQLEIRGPRYWFTMWTMSSMAVILGMQGKYFEAEELCQRVISLRTEYMGASHPFCYVSKLYLAWIYNETGRYEKSETIDLEVLEFQKKFYKDDTHHDVLLTKSQLASTYAFMGRHHEAELVKTEVLDLRLKLTGNEHPVTLRCKSSLGFTLMELGKMPEAERLLADAWAMQKMVLGSGHPETITTISRTAKIYERQGRRQEAAYLYHETVEASTRALGPGHPRTEARLEDLHRFEKARRSSETRFNLHPMKTSRAFSVNIQNSIVDENGGVDKNAN